MGIRKIILLLVLNAMLFGCKKSINTVPDVKYEGGPMVNFNNYSNDDGQPGYHKYDALLKDSFADANIEVKLSNTTETAPTDIKIFFKKVDALVSDYNTNNGTNLTAISSTSRAVAYDLSVPVIIKKGQRRASLPLLLNPLKLDLAKTNAIGLAIDRVEGARINEGKESTLVLEFGALNKYDGYYKIKGFVTHPNAAFTGPFTDQECGEVALITSGISSVDLSPGQLFTNAGTLTVFGVYPRFTVDPATNKVIISDAYPPAGVNFGAPITTYNSRYDPATKTFYVRYGWNNSRVATDTLVFCSAR